MQKLKKAVKSSRFIWNSILFFQSALIRRKIKHQKGNKFSLAYAVNTDEPTFEKLTSQLVTSSQFLHPKYKKWCGEIRSLLRFNRKTWEFNFILEALEQNGFLKPEKIGLGFGCGEEPLPAVMVNRGCSVVATDQNSQSAVQQGWSKTRQHADSIDKLNRLGISESELFSSRCSFQECDMNNIPENLRSGRFDFIWSACAFEHLGSIDHGFSFIIKSLECLKPGGLAVHTTEFNLSSNEDTFESPTCVVFRKKDLEVLVRELEKLGHTVFPLNLNPGIQPLDKIIDLPPYVASPSLKLQMDKFVITSIGLIIRKKL